MKALQRNLVQLEMAAKEKGLKIDNNKLNSFVTANYLDINNKELYYQVTH